MKLSSGTKCRCTLGELIECFDNKRIPLSAQERATRKGPYRYYGAQNVVDHIDAYLFDGEYALIAEDGENLRSQKQDVAQIVEGQFWVNNHAHIIQANANADLWYLCALLNQTDISRYISGSAQPKLSQEGMRKIVVEVPDVQEQRRIGLLLRCLDRKIALNRKKIATLEKMAKEIYDYWFVQYDFPDANGRPYKSSGGEMVYSPELKREIPKGWKVEQLKDVLKVCNGKDHKSLKDGTIPVYGSGGVMRCVDTAMYSQPSVLIPRKGTLNNIIYARKPFWCVDTIFYTTSTVSNFTKYLYYSIRDMDFMSLNTGTAVPSMTAGVIGLIAIPMPTLGLLESFDKTLEHLFLSRDSAQDEVDRLITLRDFLLPLLMNGQVRIGGVA